MVNKNIPRTIVRCQVPRQYSYNFLAGSFYNSGVMKPQIKSKFYEELTDEEKRKLHKEQDGCCHVVKSADNWIKNFEEQMKHQK
jgi:hypothetical protein